MRYASIESSTPAGKANTSLT